MNALERYKLVVNDPKSDALNELHYTLHPELHQPTCCFTDNLRETQLHFQFIDAINQCMAHRQSHLQNHPTYPWPE